MKKIICITGPSGSGKTTIANALKEYGIPELVSHTTRPIRVGEQDGTAYHFVTREGFEEIDTVERSEYAGNLYGLSREEVRKKLAENDVVALVSDIHGIRQVRAQYPDITEAIFLDVTMEEMEERMRGRGDRELNIELRLENARKHNELGNGRFCDHIVRNDILSDAIAETLEIAKREER